MKKAKEYANELKSDLTLKTFTSIANSFMLEIKELAKIRRVKTDYGLYSIFNELDIKWKAFAREFDGGVREDGFRLCIQQEFPDAYDSWMIYNQRCKR